MNSIKASCIIGLILLCAFLPCVQGGQAPLPSLFKPSPKITIYIRIGENDPCANDLRSLSYELARLYGADIITIDEVNRTMIANVPIRYIPELSVCNFINYIKTLAPYHGIVIVPC